MTKLRQRMIDDLRIRNYSPRTIETYTRCVAGFAKHFSRSPAELGPEHIREYQIFLVETKHTSWTLFNQTVCALRFLYKVTLGRAARIREDGVTHMWAQDRGAVAALLGRGTGVKQHI